MSIVVLIVGLPLTAFFVLRALIRFRKSFMGLKQQVKRLSLMLDHDILNHRLLVNADLNFAKQIAEINQQLVSMDNQLQKLENKRDNDGGYKHALCILEMGGDKEEIMKNCHLSQAEAELLINLNAYKEVVKSHPRLLVE